MIPNQILEFPSLEAWQAEATRLFGPDPLKWRFVCPVCSHEASCADWRDAGAPFRAAAFSCVGRWIPGSKDAFEKNGRGPCTYAGGGLFRLNPVKIVGYEIGPFAFAVPGTVPSKETPDG